MSRRTVASLIAVGLLLALVVATARQPVPYVTMSPGPTVNVLGSQDGKPIIDVEGHRTYPTRGELRLTTVSVTNPDAHLSLLNALAAWVEPEVAVLPYEVLYNDSSTAEQERTQSAAQMVSSQDTAVAAALTELGYRLPTYAEVIGVNGDGASDGVLKPRDRILRIEGRRIDDVQSVLDALKPVDPGQRVSGVVRRNGERRTFEVRTQADPQDPRHAVLGIIVGTGFEFPFRVSVGLDESIGGPSAGLMFALSVYDRLTPGALTQGATVAGTGTIAEDGSVGPIGGIQQKIAAAQDAGASLFFVPPGNCVEAVRAPVDEHRIRLVRAPTLHGAVASLKAYSQDPSADLPRCPS